MQEISIQVTNLVKVADNAHEHLILNHCNLKLNGEKLIAIVGPSGAGKSSLLYCMSGLDKPSQGSVSINGVDLYRLHNEKRTIFLRRNVGFIFQQYNLIPYLNVRDNILLTSTFDGREVSENRLHTLLDRFGMKDLQFESVAKLSGGEQQRVAICRAMYQNPSIIFADEPTGALDSCNTKKVVSSLFEISKQGRLVIVVTHDPNVAEIADQVIFMSDGQIKDIQPRMTSEAIQNRIRGLSYA